MYPSKRQRLEFPRGAVFREYFSSPKCTSQRTTFQRRNPTIYRHFAVNFPSFYRQLSVNFTPECRQNVTTQRFKSIFHDIAYSIHSSFDCLL